MKIVTYNADYKEHWNQFLRISKNTNFLFNRDFIEYHSHKFKDHSLIVFNEKEEIIALLPANLDAHNHLHSHQGLTFGGIVIAPEAKLILVLSIFSEIIKFLSDKGIPVLHLKQFPEFYNKYPTDEIEYALFLMNASLKRRDVALVIDRENRFMYTGNIRRDGNKAEKAGVILKEDEPFDAFWNDVLSPNLWNRFGVTPVHSLEEIKLLKSRFPDQIKQYNVWHHNELMAGTTLFISDQVVHCQYISATDEGRKNGSLNYLFRVLIDSVFSSFRFFDFGIVNENNGRNLNSGMLFWKESFGGRAQKHDFYEIDTANYVLIEAALK